MTKFFLTFFALATLAFATPALADDVEFASTLAGAGIGGAVGSVASNGNVAATIGGTVIGGVIGNELGRPSYSGSGYSRSALYNNDNNYPDDMFPHVSESSRYRPNYVSPADVEVRPVASVMDVGYCTYYSQYAANVGGIVQPVYQTICIGNDRLWHIVR